MAKTPKLPLTFEDVGAPQWVLGYTEICDADGVVLAQVITIEEDFARWLQTRTTNAGKRRRTRGGRR